MTQEKRGVQSLPAIIDMAKTYAIDAAAFVYTFKAVAMPQNSNDAEFVSCCLVAREHQLNPLTKEIYFMRSKAGPIQPIVSVDGWIKKCNEHPEFDGLEFHDVIDGRKLIAIKCSIWRKDRTRPTTVTEYMSECRRKSEKTTPWDTHPSRMLRHKALIQCARIAFGFAGVMDRDEFDEWQQTKDVTPPQPLQSAPDIPDDPPSIPDAEIIADEISDAAGYLAKLEEDVSLCESATELREIAEANADMIARLPQRMRLKAAKLFSEAAE